MSDIALMQVLDSTDSLFHIFRHKVLGTFQFVHQDSTVSILHHQEYMVFIVEEGVELDDIWVLKLGVDFELFDELVDHVVGEDCRFEYLLDGVNEACFLMLADVDIAELP
jgi:hypothetical protein